jgi:fatty-acyl-CoA synthase
MPHTALLVGAKQVLYGGPFDTALFVDLLLAERVTFSAGVVTIWQMVADELRSRDVRLPHMRHIFLGGSRPPDSLLEAFSREFGITLVQAWGMTEASPLGAVAWPNEYMRDWDPARVLESVGTRAGLPVPGVSVTLRDDEGREVPWDGKTLGSLWVRGPCIASSYVGGEAPEKFTADGWFITDDVAIGSPNGYFVIADRRKDLIKSGGEWISSAAMESVLLEIGEVAEVAVIAVPDVRWTERPLPCVVPKAGQSVTAAAVRDHLSAAGFRSWQLPERIELLAQMPRTTVGKIDKQSLRVLLAEHSPVTA